MDRLIREILTWVALAVLVTAGGYYWIEASNPASDSTWRTSRPNIILILADDMDAGLISYMDNLKNLLMDEGTIFPNFFLTSPTCCPSRATILRGQYSHNHQIHWHRPPEGSYRKFRKLGHERSTIATWLQSVGYRTALMGKYINGYPESGADMTSIPPGWDEWYAKLTFGDRLLPCADCRGNQRAFFHYQNNENGRVVNYGSAPEDYEANVMTRQAVNFIQRANADDVPFFLYLSPFAPHLPATPAPRHQNVLQQVKLPMPPSFNEADVSDKPASIRNLPLLSDQEIPFLEEYYRNRVQSILAVDEMIANITEALETANILDTTFIFFTSDNGFHMGHHRLPQGKGDPYEEDVRMPLIVKGPRVPSGQSILALVLNTDLAPTLAEIAGASVPAFVDGRSLVRLMKDSAEVIDEWRKSFILEQWRPSDEDRFEALRTSEYKYIERGNGEIELYHLPSDPYELNSIHREVDVSLIALLAMHLNELRHCHTERCNFIEDIQPLAALGMVP